jgi:large subunit ribosomal protein L1
MGKKRVSVLGSEQEQDLKAKKAVKLQQKKLREGLPAGKAGKTAKAPGLSGGQRVVDTAAESLAEFEEIQKRSAITAPTPETTTPAKKITKSRSTAYKSAKAKVDVTKSYSISDALQLLHAVNLTKFDPTVELHLNLTKPGVTVSVELPYPTGKTRKIGIADDEFIKKLESGDLNLNLDLLLASPAQMPKLVKFAKVLGPKGLMPNPKSGTVVADPAAAAKKLTGSNTITLKTEKSAPLIHTVTGKLSQPETELTANIQAIIASLTPSGISKIVLKTTMSPAIKLQI